MARNRTLSSDFWTREDVIDCSPMSRLLLLGLGNFADDHGPLRDVISTAAGNGNGGNNSGNHSGNNSNGTDGYARD